MSWAFFYNQAMPASYDIPESFSKGLYLSQSSFENKEFLSWLVDESQKYHLDTFVVDLNQVTPTFLAHIHTLKQHHISVILRVVVFPGGGSSEQVDDPSFWQRQWPHIDQVIQHIPVKAVQLDYIRYNTNQTPNPENAEKITKIVSWYQQKLKAVNTRLQLATFGISLYNPSGRIGQDLELLHGFYDTLCPMVYPSHFSSLSHSYTPFSTLYHTLRRTHTLKESSPDFKVVPYIETYNYRRKMTDDERVLYITKQIQGAYHSGTDGWIAWSANNYYKHLFLALAQLKKQNHPSVK